MRDVREVMRIEMDTGLGESGSARRLELGVCNASELIAQGRSQRNRSAMRISYNRD